MHIVVDLPPDPNRFADIIRELQSRQILANRALGVLMVAGGVIIGTGGIALNSVVPSLIGVLVFAFSTLTLRRMRKEPHPVNPAWRYTFTDEWLIAHSELIRDEIAWAAFQKARKSTSFMFLHLAKAHVIAVPLRNMAPDVQAEFCTFLRGKGLLPGGAPAPAVS